MVPDRPPVLPRIGEKASIEEAELKPAPVDDVHRFGGDLADAYARVMAWDEETRRKQEAQLVRQLDLRIALPVVIMYGASPSCHLLTQCSTTSTATASRRPACRGS
jgi:hypothetical protein